LDDVRIFDQQLHLGKMRQFELNKGEPKQRSRANDYIHKMCWVSYEAIYHFNRGSLVTRL